MKSRWMSVSLAALLLAAAATAVHAARTAESAATATAKQAQMETCFKEHGNMMSKPAVTNIRDCWRAHGYLMSR